MVDMLTKGRFNLVKLQPHVDVLSALPGEHKRHRGFERLFYGGKNPLGGRSAQGSNRIVNILADQHPPALKILAAHLQGVGYIRKVGVRLPLEVLGQVCGGSLQSRFGFARK